MTQADINRQPVILQLIEKMREYYGDDIKRIEHTMMVLGYAEEILTELGGEIVITQAAAILHDVGIPASRAKYGDTAWGHQEQLGPDIARELMADTELIAAQVDHVCKIVANHHSAKDIDTLEFQAVYDGDWLVNMPKYTSEMNKQQLE